MTIVTTKVADEWLGPMLWASCPIVEDTYRRPSQPAGFVPLAIHVPLTRASAKESTYELPFRDALGAVLWRTDMAEKQWLLVPAW